MLEKNVRRPLSRRIRKEGSLLEWGIIATLVFLTVIVVALTATGHIPR